MSNVPQIHVEDLKKKLDEKEDICVLDVREPHEYQICHIGEATLIPINDLPKRLGELKKDRETVVHCRSGGRSTRAVEFLQANGFTKVKNLAGGILAWAEKIDKGMKKY